MTSVVMYLQMHQPNRLRRYSVFDSDPFYYDEEANKRILEKVAEKCYRPATVLMRDLLERYGGDFRVTYSITGTLIEQLSRWAPDVIELLQEMASTGRCEFLAETYHHSLAFLYSREEFRSQVDLHTRTMRSLFGQTPRVFRNTELCYANDVAQYVAGMTDERGGARFDGMLCEGVDRILEYRSPNYVYHAPGAELAVAAGAGAAGGAGGAGGPMKLLLKNYRLSDDIAFRFSNRDWVEWPLTPEKFARWVHQINGDGYVCNLFMDYETFGEHQWEETGIFTFLRALPAAILKEHRGENGFRTCSEALAEHESAGEYDVPHMTSWADTERDLSAWLGNAMQSNAMTELFKLERSIKEAHRVARDSGDRERLERAEYLLADWRRLTTSDHFYYMCTKYFADGDVHRYFNPYDSPYDSYINYMNVLDNVRTRAEHETAAV